jgi:2-polyprenyl-3-methyl-5-hydroxy-6-metoxy-1,4-benzoquinol methylase
MKTKYIILTISALSALFAMCYNGTHFYHELVNPQIVVQNTTPANMQPRKQVTTFSFTVCREVEAASPPKVEKSKTSKRVAAR